MSLEAQEAKIVSWCNANDYALVKVYVDAGISDKRMGGQGGWAGIDPGPGDGEHAAALSAAAGSAPIR